MKSFPALETALLSGRSHVLGLLQQLQGLIGDRTKKFYVGHIRGHSNLPGHLGKGNYMANTLPRGMVMNTVEAKESHEPHHQNALTLKRMLHIKREQARQVIKNCDNCAQIYHPPKMGVNPRGLKALTWQKDVTHVPEFGKPAYVHVTVDTYSHVMFASAGSGEAIKDVIQHLIQSFLTMGKPMKIKTDNAPAYMSKAFASFLQAWKIMQVTGIPYNPQGQAIIERSHQT